MQVYHFLICIGEMESSSLCCLYLCQKPSGGQNRHIVTIAYFGFIGLKKELSTIIGSNCIAVSCLIQFVGLVGK